MIHKITFRKNTPITKHFEDTSSFSFRYDKKYHFVQKLCFLILNKIGAYTKNVSYESSYQTLTINTDDFINNILAQREELFHTYGFLPEKILIGSKNFAKLMSTVDFENVLQFKASYYYNKKIMELDVTVIPWMEGIIVMPAEDKLK